jgi:aspartate carbamoyltransferase catalytic subunit
MTRNLIDLNQLSVDRLDTIIHLTENIIQYPESYVSACAGKLMATLFFEPSTRTQLSFQAAMLRLGGQIIGFDDPNTSSASKGENLKDTIRVVSGYTDILVMRHPLEGAAKAASLYSQCPIINAGDGGHLHPTQTLTDVVTLHMELGRLNNLTIGLCGDLRNGRTVHSLCKCLARYPGNRFVLVSTPQLRLPPYIEDFLTANHCPFEYADSLEEAMPALDILYMTRIQRERFASDAEYQAQKGVYILNAKKLLNAKKELKILHPLPRVDEIAAEVDNDPRARYFEQARYGMFGRMALILKMLEKSKNAAAPLSAANTDILCKNTRCVTNIDTYLPALRADGRCEYCDK